MSTITDEEMRLLASRLRDSLDKANRVFALFDNVVKGGQDDEFDYEGEMIPSINKRVKLALEKAVEDGIINIPSGKVIKQIYIDDNGELIIEYQDV